MNNKVDELDLNMTVNCNLCKSDKCNDAINEQWCSSCFTKAIYDELKEYRKVEEQGLLVRLPCKVGDVVYLSTINEYMIIEKYSLLDHTDINELYFRCRCAKHDKTKGKGKRTIDVCIDCAFSDKCFQGFRLKDFGRTVFLTKEESDRAREREKNATN